MKAPEAGPRIVGLALNRHASLGQLYLAMCRPRASRPEQDSACVSSDSRTNQAFSLVALLQCAHLSEPFFHCLAQPVGVTSHAQSVINPVFAVYQAAACSSRQFIDVLFARGAMLDQHPALLE